jgi:hypothetical protein
MKYEFTKKMREISGMGGDYEETCRNMLKAGLEWLDENPNTTPEFSGFKYTFGICMADNEDAKQLSKVIVDGSGDDCTGAMHQAVVSHCLFIRTNGWDKYVEEMSKRGRK